MVLLLEKGLAATALFELFPKGLVAVVGLFVVPPNAFPKPPKVEVVGAAVDVFVAKGLAAGAVFAPVGDTLAAKGLLPAAAKLLLLPPNIPPVAPPSPPPPKGLEVALLLIPSPAPIVPAVLPPRKPPAPALEANGFAAAVVLGGAAPGNAEPLPIPPPPKTKGWA